MINPAAASPGDPQVSATNDDLSGRSAIEERAEGLAAAIGK